MLEQIWENIQRVKEESPLVHNITNAVVMNNTANALLAAGASPIMAHALEEIDEMVALCRATVVNIGTLDRFTGGQTKWGIPWYLIQWEPGPRAFVIRRCGIYWQPELRLLYGAMHLRS